MSRIRPPFKTAGGKYYLCPWVVEAFPENYRELTYIEPYAGGASVLLNKDNSKMEILNDLDESTIQIFRALRDEPLEFINRLNRLKYAADTFKKATKKAAGGVYDDYLDQAVVEFTLRRMSRNGAGKAFAAQAKADLNAWTTAIEQLPRISSRLQQVHIFNRKAVEIVKTFNAADALVYCDPPPPLPNQKSKDPLQMDNDAHIELSKALHSFWGKVVVSTQPSPLYNKLYKGWTCQKKRIIGQNQKPKIEVLWRNF